MFDMELIICVGSLRSSVVVSKSFLTATRELAVHQTGKRSKKLAGLKRVGT